MTKILFITSTRIGDAVLSTGILNHMLKTMPAPRVTIVCGPLAASLFEGVPHLDQIIALKKQTYHRHWLDLWLKLRHETWDVIVDLRDSIISRVLPAPQKFRFGNHINRTQHKVLQNAEVMKLPLKSAVPPAPCLFLSSAQKEFANKIMQPDSRKIIGVGPTANWIGKTWPADRFIAIVNYLTEAGGMYQGARVAVFAAPGEEEAAYQVFNAISDDRRLNVIAKGNPAEASACLALCDFYIGNDSGLMHAAAAAGVKTFGLFGASYANIYSPYGAHTAYAHTPETFDELTNFVGYDPKTLRHSLMTSLTTDMVKAKLNEFLKSN